MSAMEDLRKHLRRWAYAAGYIETELDAIVNCALNTHAHHLAEKQREHAEALWPGDDHPSVLRRVIAGHQADLIDPEIDLEKET